MTMIIAINRLGDGDGATRGEMLVYRTVGDRLARKPALFLFTLEDMDRGLDYDGVKEAGSTAIPCGRYEIELYNSPRHGPDTLQLRNVPQFKNIQIHVGNYVSDTEGCILVGTFASPHAFVGSSRLALSRLKELVVPHIKQGGRVIIEIARSVRYA